MDYTLVVSNSGNSTFKETVAKFKITCVGQCDGVVGKCEIMWDNSFKGHEHVSAWLHCMINNPDLSSADFLGMLSNFKSSLTRNSIRTLSNRSMREPNKNVSNKNASIWRNLHMSELKITGNKYMLNVMHMLHSPALRRRSYFLIELILITFQETLSFLCAKNE